MHYRPDAGCRNAQLSDAALLPTAPGTCSPPCSEESDGRDQWGNCIDMGCNAWFDGCNTCTGRGRMRACTEMWCNQRGQAECRDEAGGSDSGGMSECDACHARQARGENIACTFPGGPCSTGSVQTGGRCAQGFCENPNNCPQCAAGLTCNVPQGMMCAGTCYGTCAKGH